MEFTCSEKRRANPFFALTATAFLALFSFSCASQLFSFSRECFSSFSRQLLSSFSVFLQLLSFSPASQFSSSFSVFLQLLSFSPAV